MSSSDGYEKTQLAGPPLTTGFVTRWRLKLEPALLILMTPVVIIWFYLESVDTFRPLRIASRLAGILVFILIIWNRVRPLPKRVLFKRSHVLIYWITVGAGVSFLVLWAPTAEIYRRPVLAGLFTVAIVWTLGFLIWKVRQSIIRH